MFKNNLIWNIESIFLKVEMQKIFKFSISLLLSRFYNITPIVIVHKLGFEKTDLSNL